MFALCVSSRPAWSPAARPPVVLRALRPQPNRRQVILDLMEQFIREYFDQNPLSQLGLIVAANKLSYRVTDLSGNPEAQIQAMRECAEQGGDFGMQNALEMARDKLKSVAGAGSRAGASAREWHCAGRRFVVRVTSDAQSPTLRCADFLSSVCIRSAHCLPLLLPSSQIPPYGSREILLLMSALSTVDPGDLHDTIAACHASHICCSVISLSAEMYVATLLATTTGGQPLRTTLFVRAGMDAGVCTLREQRNASAGGVHTRSNRAAEAQWCLVVVVVVFVLHPQATATWF